MKHKHYKRKLLQDADITKIVGNLEHQSVKLSDLPVCDFCGSAWPMWVYASKRTSTGQDIECWRWTACHACNLLILLNDWGSLKTVIFRAVERIGRVLDLSDPLIRRAVDLSMNEFLDNAIEEEEDAS